MKAPEGLRCGRRASAIETAESSARATDRVKARRECLAGAVQADGGGAGSNSFTGGEELYGHAVHFDAFQSAGVVCVELAQLTSRARAGVWLTERFDLIIERRVLYENLCSGGSTTIVIDDRVTQQLIEPGIGAASVAQLGKMFHGTQVSRVEEVLGLLDGIDSLPHKREERCAPVAQMLKDATGDFAGEFVCWIAAHKLRRFLRFT